MMRRLFLTLAVTALAVSFAVPTEARRSRRRRRRPRAAPVRVLKRVDVDQRTRSPTFYSRTGIWPMDSGRLLYLGSGMWHEQGTFYFLRASDNRRVTVRAPLHAYLERTPEILPQHARPVHKHFETQRLLFYDQRTREAGIEVADSYTARRTRRYFYLHWNLATNTITEATLVARTVRNVSYASLAPIGYDAAQRTYYYARDVRRHAGGTRTVTVVGFASGKPRIVAQFQTRRRLNRRAWLDPLNHRAFLAEYAELAGDRAHGYIVDLRSGNVKKVVIPLVTYGAAFDPNGRSLYAYSAKHGMIWGIDIRSGQTTRVGKVGALGHELAVLPGGQQLLLLRNSGMQFVSLPSLRPGRFVASKTLYPGFSHVQGSRVVGRRAYIKNGDTLHVVSF
ncbi:MAG: hypothetical protein KC503_35360 [Myxococcales bacterium]|nr:hypothetical protein [Myxococcales bacterium]